MDEAPEQPEPKISLPEALFIGFVVLVLDLIDLIPIAGDITDIFTTPLNFYLYLKGVKQTWFVISQVLDLIPVVQEFPSRSIAWWVLIYTDRNPSSQVGAAIEKVGEIEAKAGSATGAIGKEGGTAGGTGGAAHEAMGEGGTTKPVVESEGASDATGARRAGAASATEAGGEPGSGEENAEGREKLLQEKETEKELESGEKAFSEERAEEELFNPQEAQFHEAGGPSLKTDGGLSSKEAPAGRDASGSPGNTTNPGGGGNQGTASKT